MRSIIKKTEKEKRKEAEYIETKVCDSGNWYWACEYCKNAFFDGDSILRLSTGGYYCMNIVKKGILQQEQKCMGRIYGGDKDCFNEYYKFK